MTSNFLPTPYHQQDDNTWCGLAVVQMILGARRENPLTDQSILKRGFNIVVGADVTMLCDLLNGPNGNDYEVSICGNYQTALRGIVDSILTTGLAVPALIFGPENHWVLVKGALLDGDAQAGGTYTVRGLYIANPSPDTPMAKAKTKKEEEDVRRDYGEPPFPHQMQDACGEKGGATGASSTFVSEYAWRVQHWLATEGDNPTRFVTILNRGNASSVKPIPEIINPPTAVALPWTSTEDGAKAAARAGIQANGLDVSTVFGSAFVGAQPTLAECCHELTPVDDWWWRVSFSDAGGTVVGSAAVAAADGTFLGAMAPDVRCDTPYVLIRACDDLNTRAEEFHDVLGDEPLQCDEVLALGLPFWRLSAESQSRYYSFQNISVRGHELVVGVDGRVRRSLHPSACQWTEHAHGTRT
jgi:hypothetical protein